MNVIKRILRVIGILIVVYIGIGIFALLLAAWDDVTYIFSLNALVNIFFWPLFAVWLLTGNSNPANIVFIGVSVLVVIPLALLYISYVIEKRCFKKDPVPQEFK